MRIGQVGRADLNIPDQVDKPTAMGGKVKADIDVGETNQVGVVRLHVGHNELDRYPGTLFPSFLGIASIPANIGYRSYGSVYFHAEGDQLEFGCCSRHGARSSHDQTGYKQDGN